MGFDPIMQFIHEDDMARIIEMSVQSDHYGIYNLTGEGVVPYTAAIEIAGGTPVPVPHFVAYPFVNVLDRLGLNFPMHLLDYFKYPTILSDEAFRRDFDWSPSVETVEALRSVRETVRA